MNANDDVAILRKHNEWRRADPPEGPDGMPDMTSACSARDIGVAIDVLCNEIERLRAELEELKRGEFICRKCGLRNNSEHAHAEF